MISKCPECGRSYPAHHGSICKMCASKKAKAEESTKEKELEQAAAQPVKVAPKEIKNTNQGSMEIMLKSEMGLKPEEETIFFKQEKKQEVVKSDFVDVAVLAGNRQEDAMKKISEKAKSVLDICPNCQAPNAGLALFCVECGKMLTLSIAEDKIIDYKLNEVRGITKDQLEILKKEGVETTLKLLDKAYSPTKRKTLVLKTNINEILLYRLVNQCDLMRIDGVTPLNAYLLDLIGISTIKLLEKKTAKDVLDLIAQKKSILYAKQVIILPEEKLVKRWIEDAKKIQKVVS